MYYLQVVVMSCHVDIPIPSHAKDHPHHAFASPSVLVPRDMDYGGSLPVDNDEMDGWMGQMGRGGE